MHGRKAYELVKEFADGEKGHLKIFNNELFERVIEECNEHHNALQSLIRWYCLVHSLVNRPASDLTSMLQVSHSTFYRFNLYILEISLNKKEIILDMMVNADHYGALIHHLSLIRNKRCLMAYVLHVHQREIIRELAWKVGLLHELPGEIQEKFSDSEEQYFKDHSNLDVNVDMVPPKDPYIKVRVLEDLGSGIILSDKSANFARHSMHFLKRN
ncbi:hypothetical protein V6Z11_1Z009400 [Gossypium hirsutum]